ncbi:MAG TPA: hypothetical protein VHX38_35640 [Pseudonocardiaceae bacterium]|nr:hypothetical protein [Pseudonocardiaceae bacterium]
MAEGVMTTECRYAAALLASLVGPSAEVARWLESPTGVPPVDLALMASMLNRTAARLAELSDIPSGGAS